MASPRKRTSLQQFWTALLGLAATILPGFAQIPWATERFDRANKSEVYGIGQYLHSSDISYNGPGGNVKVHMNDTGLGGFGFAYHINDFLSLRSDFMFGSATFSGDYPTQTGGTANIKQDAFIQTGRFNIDYNMINRRLTPILTAGIGYQYLQTELQNVPPQTICWWDPWWGWICETSSAMAWETDFTWNVGAGFRWNITDALFVKVMGGANWLQYSGANGITTQIEGIFSIGWTF
jgi:opacity protein-like surface antigen